eukprot:CAMPEP_0115047140 /NCGR_PEP_ID=MMETSP0216-20121206/49145_1 /TAXON_ID=223996 /ORGANISM="Protocruzia adherens, Strain Boccale" /LENGTH=575 /DNA_ID=CAMNT_0002430311 /DNA_START=65 /DNA_END=1792 /DNA_ORIENTATION=+
MRGWTDKLTRGLASSSGGGDAAVALKTYLLKGKERQKKYADYGKGDISSTEPIYKLNRQKTDLFFMIMYVYLFGFAIFSGFYALYTKKDFKTNLITCYSKIFDDSTYFDSCSATRLEHKTEISASSFYPLGYYFMESVDVFALMAIMCTYVGFVWIAALGFSPAKVVKGTVYAIPSVIVLSGALSLIFSQTYTWVVITLGVLTILGGGAIFLIINKCLGESMDKTIRLFEYSLEILDDTPFLYVTSFGGIAVQFVIGTLFVAFFGFGLGNGEFVVIPVDADAFTCTCTWVSSPMLPKYLTFMIAICLWTLSFILTICNGTIAGSATQYYFSSQVERDAIQEDRTATSFKHCIKNQLGSLAIGALVSNILIMISQYFSGMKEAIRKKEGEGALGKCFKSLLRCVFYVIINILDRCLRYINYFSIYYVATRAEGFCESAKKSYGIMSRAQLSPYGVHTFTSWFIFITTNIIAFFFGGIAFVWTSNRTADSDSETGRDAGIVGFVFTYLLVNMIFAMFSNVIISLSDSLCFCYAIQNEIKTNEAAPNVNNDDKLHQDVADIFDDLRVKEADDDDSDDE